MAKEATVAAAAAPGDPYTALNKANEERATMFVCARCGGTVFDFHAFGTISREGDEKIGHVIRTDATCGTCHALYPLDGVK